MNSLVATHDILLKERTSSIRRGLMDRINRGSRLIAVKGSRGVGKTNFLLDFSKEFHAGDESCLYVNANNLFIVHDGLFHFVERFYKLGGKKPFGLSPQACVWHRPTYKPCLPAYSGMKRLFL